MIKLQDKMELQMKQRGNLMTRDEVIGQVMNYTMGTAVNKCLHLCTEVTALCREHFEKVKTKENSPLEFCTSQ